MPADLGSADVAGSQETGTGALILFKLVCCGGPLLVLAVASGVVALSAILAGAGGLALAAGAFLLLRPLARRRAEALSRERAPRETGHYPWAGRDAPQRPEGAIDGT